MLSQLWLRLSGYSREQLKPHILKTVLSPLMPLLIASGLAMIMTWARVDSPASGVLIAGQVWLFLVAPVRLYSYVYSPEKAGLLAMDALHLLLGRLTAGAIIGAWR